MSSDSSIPSIRTFQMDASTVGVLKSSVNLFRGDVNYTQSLFTLPGRTADDGLQVDVSLQYQSNVHRRAIIWNRDAPTGVLGLGWELPLATIRYDSGGSAVPGAGSYSISLSGVDSALAREEEGALLLSLDGSVCSQLADRQPVPGALRAEFVRRGLPLSTGAEVEGSASPWTLRDDEFEQEFRIVLAGGALQVYDGGTSFQLVAYRFWKVVYYARYESWCVTNESSQRMSFGGGLATPSPDVLASAGNSIEWAVQWHDASGVPSWQGSSALATGQQQYAVAWHLTRSYSRFGEFVSYGYNEFPREADGLIPEVEQRVGLGGKAYTKACYLTSVTDVFGRKASFRYAPKLWSDATPASAREYADPHKAVPDHAPNGFQDRYETRYLERIDVTHVDGSPLFSVALAYAPSPDRTGEEAVVNLAGSSGDMCKRLLTSIRLENADEDALPGYVFDYYLDPSERTNVGALRSITWPTGGLAVYRYLPLDLNVCNRTAAMTPPPPMPEASTPRVWFGANYAVVLWSSSGTQQLSLQIVSWDGQWTSWQASAASALLAEGTGGTSLDTVSVLTGDEFVAITYSTSQNHNLHLFRKDPARPGQWTAALVEGGGSGGCNSPTWQWAKRDGEVTTLAGDNFIVASQMNTSTHGGSYDVFTWRWPTRNWTRSRTSCGYAWLAAGRDYFVRVDMSPTWSSSSSLALAPGARAARPAWASPSTTTPRSRSLRTYPRWPSRTS